MKVLYVEDSAADARLVLDQLAEAASGPFVLTHVQRIAEAVELLRRQPFDAVLLDLQLPDAYSLEALSDVIRNAPDLPVVVLSGLEDETLAMEAVQQGAQDYLLKGNGDGTQIARALRYAVERKRSERQMQYLATHDGLTHLPNRRLLMDRLGQAMARSRRERKHLALLFVDLDDFKSINDTLGHDAGDEVLVGVATRLQACMRQSDTVARLGGDEFTLVLPELAHAEDADRFADKVREAVRAPMVVRGQELRISASVGISRFPDDGDSAWELMRSADAAMYEIKRRERHVTREPAWVAAGIPRQIGEDLETALLDGQFAVHYQPQVDARTHRIVGLEALLRWNHPRWGLLLPSTFLPVAERLGVMPTIDAWVLREACGQAKAWREHGITDPVRISVNVSSRELGKPWLPATLERVLADTGFPPSHLVLEVSEAAMAPDDEQAQACLLELRALGVQVAMDHFGTGPASLLRLKRFPVDVIKIDRAFVHGVSDSVADEAIVDGIVTMAHALDVKVTAEAVERAPQAERLTDHGCDELQGFLFGAARTPDDLVPALAPGAPPLGLRAA